MGNRDFSGVRVILIFLLVVLVFFGIGYTYSKGVCDAKTTGIGFAHRFSLMGGCQIEATPGQWIPLENYYVPQK